MLYGSLEDFTISIQFWGPLSHIYTPFYSFLHLSPTIFRLLDAIDFADWHASPWAKMVAGATRQATPGGLPGGATYLKKNPSGAGPGRVR